MFSGDPLPMVTWWRNGKLIDETFTIDSTNSLVTNELILPSIDRSDLLSVLTCQSSNSDLLVPSEASISLDLIRKYKVTQDAFSYVTSFTKHPMLHWIAFLLCICHCCVQLVSPLT